MDTNIHIKEANLNQIETCASIVLLGKRRTGKTTMSKHILQYLNRDIDRFVAMCGNKDNAAEWKQIIQPLYVTAKNITYLKKLRDYQDGRVSSYSENQKPIPRKYRICVILDDCGSDRSFMFDPIIRDILSNGRHYGMTLLILCQYLNQMHSENRDQIDYVGMLYTSNQKNIKKIHDEYVNVCDIRTFKCVLNACTTQKGMCWIDNTKIPKTIDDCVFFKRIPWPPEFQKVGTSHVRTYGNCHYIEMKKNKVTESSSVDLSDGSDSEHSDEGFFRPGEIPLHILHRKNIFTDAKGTVSVVLKAEDKNKQKIE